MLPVSTNIDYLLVYFPTKGIVSAPYPYNKETYKKVPNVVRILAQDYHIISDLGFLELR